MTPPDRTKRPLLALLFVLSLAPGAKAGGSAIVNQTYSPPDQRSGKEDLRSLIWVGSMVLGTTFLDQPSRRFANALKVEGAGKDSFGHDGTLVERLGRGDTDLELAGVFYLGGALSGSERMRRVGVLGGEAVLAAGLTTLAVKNTVGRRRPNRGGDPDEFRLFEGGRFDDASFPSGHTSTAFALAAVVVHEYPSPWVFLAGYGTASLVGVSRVYQGMHWCSDVFAGAALGIIVGRSICRWESKHGWSAGLYADGRGLFIRKRF